MLFKVKWVLFVCLFFPLPLPSFLTLCLGKRVLGGASCSSADTTATGSGSTQNQLVMMLGAVSSFHWQWSSSLIPAVCFTLTLFSFLFRGLCPAPWSVFLNHSEIITELSFVAISIISDYLCSYALSLLSAGLTCLHSDPVVQRILVLCLVPLLAL